MLNSLSSFRERTEYIGTVVKDLSKFRENVNLIPPSGSSILGLRQQGLEHDPLKVVKAYHEGMKIQLDTMYKELTLPDTSDNLREFPVLLLDRLLRAKDLKIEIRTSARSSFFEYDTIDQAIGGRNQALGKFSLRSRFITIGLINIFLDRDEITLTNPPRFSQTTPKARLFDQ